MEYIQVIYIYIFHIGKVGDTHKMKTTAKVHYAIVIMTDIAMQGKGAVVTGNDIARRQNISFSFVAQLLNKLKKDGLLKSIRGGVSGGYQLKGLSSEVIIKKVVDAIDPNYCICPSEKIKTGQPLDETVRDFWEEVEAGIEITLESTTLGDLVKRTPGKINN